MVVRDQMICVAACYVVLTNVRPEKAKRSVNLPKTPPFIPAGTHTGPGSSGRSQRSGAPAENGNYTNNELVACCVCL